MNTISNTNNEVSFAYSAFQVVGNSMDDGTRSSFEAGDKLLTIPIEVTDLKAIINEDLENFWVIEVNKGILFKQITAYDEQSGEITCHSLNVSYPDYPVQVRDISRIYRVVQKQGRPIFYGD